MMPHLKMDGYEITSDPTVDYNCLGWAVYDDEHWWAGYQEGLEPEDDFYPTRFWPLSPPPTWDGITVDVLTAAYATRGYVVCADGVKEEGWHKLAIFADSAAMVRHAARQCEDGRWTSKIGYLEDIGHTTLWGIECPTYGRPVRFMRKPRAQSQDAGASDT